MIDITVTITTGPNDSHWQLLKCLNPDIYLWRHPGCPHCEAASAYFKENGCRVTHWKLTAADHQAHGCRAQVKHKEQQYAVELPDVHGVAAEAVPKRLKAALEGRTRRPAPHEHQRDLVDYLKTRDFSTRHTPAFTVYWEMGSGKTLGALFVTQSQRCKRTIVVCHNSTIGYWASSIRAVPFDGDIGATVMMMYEVIGYTAFRNVYAKRSALSHVDCLVIDEAHYFRNSTDSMQPVIHATHGAKNILLLTGTPLVNADTDIVGMLQLTDMAGTFDWRRGADSDTGLPAPETIHAFLDQHVSWYDPKVHRDAMYRKHYPTVDKEIVWVPMTWRQTLEYMMAREATFRIGGHTITGSKSNRYNSRTRAICNAPEADPQSSNKLRAIVRRAGQFVDTGPQFVHSSLVESCLDPLIDMVKAHPKFEKKTTANITGKTPTAEREGIQRAYNRNKIDVLFISDASQFGMDLQGTACMHMAEPHPNVQTELQTSARGVRMGSHESTTYKHVYQFYYVSTFPRTPMTAADVDDIKRYVMDIKLFGNNAVDARACVDAINFQAELTYMIGEEFGETINERMRRVNDQKHADIQPYLNAGYRRSSIDMTKQKGARLFDTDASDRAKRPDTCNAATQTTLRGVRAELVVKPAQPAAKATTTKAPAAKATTTKAAAVAKTTATTKAPSAKATTTKAATTKAPTTTKTAKAATTKAPTTTKTAKAATTKAKIATKPRTAIRATQQFDGPFSALK